MFVNSQSNNVVIQFSHSLTLLEFIANSTILLSNDLTKQLLTVVIICQQI